MANPRYFQQPQTSRERKASAYQDFQAGQQRQQALNQNAQSDMMRQLQELYQMSQAQQMDPLKMEALRAGTEAQVLANEQQRFQNQWAQPNAEAAYNLAQAQAQALQQKGSGALTDRDFMEYEMALGKLHPNDPRAIKAAQEAEVARRAAIEADAAAQTGGAEVLARPPVGFGEVGQQWGAGLSDSIMDMPSTIYNAAGVLSDFALGLLGVPSSTARVHPYSAQKAAWKRGTDYGSVFYNPRDPVGSQPLPIAKERKQR